MNRHLLSRPLVAAALALACLASAPAAAYDSLVVFGDSLSDSGNNFNYGLFDPGQLVTSNSYVPSNTYASGTYSNGPVWATTFASSLGLSLTPSFLGGTNFAFGGATTGTPGPGMGGFPFSLLAQTQQYLTTPGRVVSSEGLYVVAGGGNNARAALDLIGGGANFFSTASSFAAAFANDIGSIVDSLQLAGAEDIIVWNTPNLGLAPASLATPFSAAASALASIMNQALALRLAGEVGVTTFDIYSFATLVAADPSAYGFTNVVDACGAGGSPCATSLFYDGIHPSAAGHAAIAEAVLALTIVPVPEPETYALMLAGLAALGWRARRRSGRAVAAA